MKFLLLMTSLMLITGTAYSYEGQDRGNGGDSCENNFNEIKIDIDSWIKNGGAHNLKLKQDVSIEEYSTKMRDLLYRAQISCTTKELFVGKAEKTCKNFMDNGVPRIVCNIDRFANTSIEEQYILVHHEYAGLAGLETNTGEASTYTISNQISHFLDEKVVTKLAITFDDTLRKKTLDTFLKEANDPKSAIGAYIAKVNEEQADGRNPEGVIELPVKRSAVQISVLQTEEIHNWSYGQNKGPSGCFMNDETSVFLISLTSNQHVRGASYVEKYTFTVVTKKISNIKRKDGEPLEHCQEYFDDEQIPYVFSSEVMVGKFKVLELKIDTDSEDL